jgi:hypothetical protein
MAPNMPITLIHVLAQPEQSTSRVMIWAIVLVLALMLLLGVVVIYRKWMNTDDTPSGPGFTLSDLRRLHKEGKMTTEEYEKAKTVLIGSLKAAADKPPNSPKPGPRTNPPGFDVLPPEH